MQGEKVWAYGGYRGDPTILHRFLAVLTCEFKREMARGRTRHETVNGKLMDWPALRDVYRHDLNKHHLIFGAHHSNASLNMILHFFGEPVTKAATACVTLY